jgi:GT2 family glycosyltransferase
MEKVTVYIPCYNAERYLKDCLQAVLKQTHAPDEVLVIDDGSTDRTTEIASSYPVRLIRHRSNKGLAAARNTAVLNSRNEWIASVDADVVAAHDWLEKLVKSMNGDGIAGVGGKLVEKFQQRLADRWRAVHMPQHWGDCPNGKPLALSGSNALFKASALREVGLYNEKFRTNYEDSDICGRLRARGYRLFYTPHAVCYHLREDTIRSILRTWWRWHAPPWQQQAFTRDVLFRKLKNDLGHLRRLAFYDLRHFRLRLASLDLLSMFYSIYADVRWYGQARSGK